MQVSGTADPLWNRLLAELGQNSLEAAAQLQSLFAPGRIGDLIHAVPSDIATALIKGLASNRCSRLLQSSMLKALLQVVLQLRQEGDAVSIILTPSKVCPSPLPPTQMQRAMLCWSKQPAFLTGGGSLRLALSL